MEINNIIVKLYNSLKSAGNTQEAALTNTSRMYANIISKNILKAFIDDYKTNTKLSKKNTEILNEMYDEFTATEETAPGDTSPLKERLP